LAQLQHDTADEAEGWQHSPPLQEFSVQEVGRLNRHMAWNRQTVGHVFLAAELDLAQGVRRVAAHAPLMATCPAVTAWLAAWLAACQARPGFQAMWSRRLAEPAWRARLTVPAPKPPAAPHSPASASPCPRP